MSGYLYARSRTPRREGEHAVSTKARAAVVDSATSGVAITDIELADLRSDEVLVRVVSTGVCHSVFAWADGALFDSFPVVLGL
jgi:Zn-dependent alcohol dehydrogenase